MKTNSASPRLLVADDQGDVLEAIRLLLKPEGYAVTTVSSPPEVLEAVARQEFDVLLIDLNYTRDTTSGSEGLELVSRLKELDENIPVVVMTAWGSIDLAVEAMRRGARDFVQKPWDNARLLAALRTQAELSAALARELRLEAENQLLRESGPDFIAGSAAMKPVLELIARVASTEANVLVLGESGTGKGLVARALHAGSERRGGAFVTVNMGGLPEGVFESELFGHVRGAFTDARSDRIGRFELARGGTLFQDEIANLTLGQQARLLRVIETGEFEPVGSSRTRKANVRIVSATNADLRAEVAAGRFRQDLLFRLNTVEIRLPNLRDRPEDIEPLANHFLAIQRAKHRKASVGFHASAIRAMLAYSWPGNVRELEHVVERGILMASGRDIADIDLGLAEGATGSASVEDMALEDVEALLIRKALSRFEGNVSKAAEFLGLSRSALYRRLQRHSL
jgi:DNA-binding NtrC family response regulator